MKTAFAGLLLMGGISTLACVNLNGSYEYQKLNHDEELVTRTLRIKQDYNDCNKITVMDSGLVSSDGTTAVQVYQVNNGEPGPNPAFIIQGMGAQTVNVAITDSCLEIKHNFSEEMRPMVTYCKNKDGAVEIGTDMEGYKPIVAKKAKDPANYEKTYSECTIKENGLIDSMEIINRTYPEFNMEGEEVGGILTPHRLRVTLKNNDQHYLSVAGSISSPEGRMAMEMKGNELTAKVDYASKSSLYDYVFKAKVSVEGIETEPGKTSSIELDLTCIDK